MSHLASHLFGNHQPGANKRFCGGGLVLAALVIPEASNDLCMKVIDEILSVQSKHAHAKLTADVQHQCRRLKKTFLATLHLIGF